VFAVLSRTAKVYSRKKLLFLGTAKVFSPKIHNHLNRKSLFPCTNFAVKHKQKRIDFLVALLIPTQGFFDLLPYYILLTFYFFINNFELEFVCLYL